MKGDPYKVLSHFRFSYWRSNFPSRHDRCLAEDLRVVITNHHDERSHVLQSCVYTGPRSGVECDFIADVVRQD